MRTIIEQVDYVIEATRYRKEKGADPDRGLEKLSKWVDEGDVYMHFSNIDKVGVNPNQQYRTPMGIYAYPFDRKWFNIMRHGKIPFAGERKFIHLVQLKNPKNFVRVRSGGNANYSRSQYKKDVAKLEKKYGSGSGGDIGLLDYYNHRKSAAADRWTTYEDLWTQFVSKSEKEANIQTPFGLIFNLTRLIAFNIDRSSDLAAITTWNKILRSDIGIDGVIDMGSGIIHRNEPEQVVILDPRAFKRVETVTKEEVMRSKNIGIADDPVMKSLEAKVKQFAIDIIKLDPDKDLSWRLPFLDDAEMAYWAKEYAKILQQWDVLWADAGTLKYFTSPDPYVQDKRPSPMKHFRSLYKRIFDAHGHYSFGLDSDPKNVRSTLETVLIGFRDLPKLEAQAKSFVKNGDIEGYVGLLINNKTLNRAGWAFRERERNFVGNDLYNLTDIAFGSMMDWLDPKLVAYRANEFLDVVRRWQPSRVALVKGRIDEFLSQYYKKHKVRISFTDERNGYFEITRSTSKIASGEQVSASP